MKESISADQAHKLGLTYMGHGYWQDKNGDTVAKTVNGKLVKLDHETDSQSFLLRAFSFAKRVHSNQKYGKFPYTYHLAKVARVGQDFGANPIQLTACLLHDTIEDTPTTKDQLAEMFGNDVADIVDAVSNQPSKEETLRRIRLNPDAVFVKLCDRIANCEEGQKNDKYRREQLLFKKILYKSGEYDQMWERLEEALRK